MVARCLTSSNNLLLVRHLATSRPKTCGAMDLCFPNNHLGHIWASADRSQMSGPQSKDTKTSAVFLPCLPALSVFSFLFPSYPACPPFLPSTPHQPSLPTAPSPPGRSPGNATGTPERLHLVLRCELFLHLGHVLLREARRQPDPARKPVLLVWGTSGGGKMTLRSLVSIGGKLMAQQRVLGTPRST